MDSTPKNPPPRTRQAALKVALLYVLVAVVWFFVADALLTLLAPEAGRLGWRKAVEGWIFVLFSALLLYFLVRHYIGLVRHRETRLRKILMGLSVRSGEDFFTSLVESLAQAFQSDAAMLCEIAPGDSNRLRVLAGWQGGTLIKPHQCPLADGPCLKILEEKKTIFFPRGLRESFPCLGLGEGWRPESFIGTPLIDSEGRAIGVLVLLHSQPLKDPRLGEELIPFLGLQTAAEIERRRAEEALRVSEYRFRSVFETTAAGMVIMNPDGRMIRANQAFRTFLGYSEEELTSMSIVDVSHPDDRQKTLENYSCLAAGTCNNLHYEKRYLTRDGRVVWGHASVACLLGEAATPSYCIGLVQDITEQKRVEKELRESNRELDAFVYTVSHDLRSPLTPIIGYAEFLREHCRERLDEQTSEILGNIQRQGEKMLALLEDLLSLAKVGKIECAIEPLAAGEVLEDTVEERRSRLHEKGLTVLTDGSLPPIGLPKTLLAQIFGNLIDNAILYAGAEGGPIEIGGRRRHDRVHFFVRDHGPGIPEDEREKIFDVFTRGSTGEGLDGTGIGLATVQKIVRLYQGRAWVEETPGGGATFWVEMVDECAPGLTTDHKKEK